MTSSPNTPRFNLPTILTLSRVLLIPVFVIITPDRPFLGAILFGIASLTDFLDGYLARKSGQVTQFGMILDPIADKFLVISALILLVEMGILETWIASVLIIRDFLITALRVVALSKDIVIAAEMGGKLKTAAQITSILCLVLSRPNAGVYPIFDYIGLDLFDIGIVFIYIALVLSVLSGIQYTVSFWKKI